MACAGSSLRAMGSAAYKAWLDAMPIDDVRSKIHRLEQKLSDLRVLERLYAVRQPISEPGGAKASEYADVEAFFSQETPSRPDDESLPKRGPAPT